LSVEGAEGLIEVFFDGGSVVSAMFAGPHPEAALGDLLVRSGMITPDMLGKAERARQSASESFDRLLVRHAHIPLQSVEEVRDLVTQEAIVALLRWSHGSFDFVAQPVTHGRRPHQLLPAEQILMDGLRLVDEWRSFAPEVTREDTVFERCGDFEQYVEANPSESKDWLSAAERLFMLIDGRLSVRRVIELARLGTFEGCRLLDALVTCGLIDSVVASRSGRGRLRIADELTGSTANPALAVLPFAALLGLLWWASAAPTTPLPDGVLSTSGSPIGAVAAHYDTLRMRRLSDICVLGHQEPLAHPRDLGGEARAVLAPEGHAPYYLVRENGDLIVLVPEH
jgi:hypothetical protein